VTQHPHHLIGIDRGPVNFPAVEGIWCRYWREDCFSSRGDRGRSAPEAKDVREVAALPLIKVGGGKENTDHLR
jgi:hypothetical protein